MESKPPHPLQQIADTPTHRLLLKQWLKEEDLIFHRVALKETQLDSVRRELTTLYVLFFLFHSLSLLLLFSASGAGAAACGRAWLPSLCQVAFSMGLIWAVRYKGDAEARLEKLVAREKEDAKLLGRCSEELKKKGLEFDLLREVDALRRAKSLRAEAGPARRWAPRDFVVLVFFGVACLVVGVTRIVLCD